MMRAVGTTRSARTLWAALLALWLVLPIFPLAIWSFARGWRFPDLLPRDWTLQAWRYALGPVSGVVPALGQSLSIALCATALAITFGLPAGWALGRYRFRGKSIAELAILAPVIVPGLTAALGIHSVFIGLGLTNGFTGVVLVHLIPTLPYMILVSSGVIANHDPAYAEQARSLGASALGAFRHATLPAILPGLLAGALFVFLVSWSQYLLTLLIGGGRVATLPLVLFSFAASGRNDIAGAIAMIYILPGVLILLITSRLLSGKSAAARGFAQL
jgi:putative spermidine/putrescine transport system permease protein